MATLGTFTTGQVLTAAELNAIGTWTAYTPTWTNLTVGNATQDFQYLAINKIGFIRGVITLGTTSTVGTNARFSMPSGWTTTVETLNGFGRFTDVGPGVDVWGGCIRATDTTLYPFVFGTAGTYASGALISTTVPFSWANTDAITVGAVVRLS